jgi:putative copper export protein
MYTYILLTHILAATIWTGGHLVLSMLILPKALKAKDPEILLEFENGFEKIGMPALLLQVATGLWLAYQLVPEVSRWFSFEDYTTTSIALKLIVLGITAAFALNARFRVVPKLSADTLVLFAWHIVPVTILSVCFVILGVGIRAGGY